MKVLFVCRGNVGRSQMAEAIFRQLASEKHFAHSAGTEAMGSEGKDLNGLLLADRESSKYVIESLEEIGMYPSNALIKRLTPEMLRESDAIVVLVKPDTVPDSLRDSDKVIYWDIVDPDGQTLEFHRQTRDQIKVLVEKFIERDLSS